MVVVLVAGITTWVTVDASNDATDDNATGGSSRIECATELPTEAGAATVGAPAPNFVLRDLDGSCVDLAALRGQPVIVNFWASWCNPCREEFPLFRTTRERYSDQGLEILGIVHDDIPSDARRFARQERAKWPLLLDETDAVFKAYGGIGIPETFFVARDGTVSARFFVGFSRQEFNEELERILASEG